MALPPKVFDRPRIAAHLARRPQGADDFVTRLVLDDLAERMLAVLRTFSQALIMGPDGRALPEAGQTAGGRVAFERVSTLVNSHEAPLVDAEALLLPRRGYDLIVSVLDLQVVNDVPGFLARVRAHLRPDGLFIAVALGGETLFELRDAFLAADAQISGGAFARVAPFIPLADVGGLLQRTGYALPVTDVETHTVRYRSPVALFEELKRLGAQNPLAERPTRLATPALVAAAAEAYGSSAADPDGRVRATLELIWMSGWAPHESQQKPAARGSATISLKDVLEPKRGG